MISETATHQEPSLCLKGAACSGVVAEKCMEKAKLRIGAAKAGKSRASKYVTGNAERTADDKPGQAQSETPDFSMPRSGDGATRGGDMRQHTRGDEPPRANPPQDSESSELGVEDGRPCGGLDAVERREANHNPDSHLQQTVSTHGKSSKCAKGKPSKAQGERDGVSLCSLPPSSEPEQPSGGTHSLTGRLECRRGANDNPTGAEMVARQHKIKENLRWMLPHYPQAKGDDFLCELRYRAKYEPDTIDAIIFILRHWAYGTGEGVPRWVFPKLLMASASESIRRRRQELQSEEKHAIKQGIMTIEEAQFVPRERTIIKRETLETAMRHDLGKGQLCVSDYLRD